MVERLEYALWRCNLLFVYCPWFDISKSRMGKLFKYFSIFTTYFLTLSFYSIFSHDFFPQISPYIALLYFCCLSSHSLSIHLFALVSVIYSSLLHSTLSLVVTLIFIPHSLFTFPLISFYYLTRYFLFYFLLLFCHFTPSADFDNMIC